MSASASRTRILVVDDEEIVRESLSAWLRKDGYSVLSAESGTQALERAAAEPFHVLLADLKMPGMDGLQLLAEVKRRQPDTVVVIMTAFAAVDTAVNAMKDGAYDYLVKPFDPEELSQMLRKIVAQQALQRENLLLRKLVKREGRFRDLVSRSPAMQQLFDLARTAANSGSTILILGESGTGKELLARAIHAESPRRAGPFVAVSCAALTETLLESELFGYEKGAFTGAVGQRRGKFEMARGGTLFLDEIGDVSPKLQLDLLRVLEDRRFYRVGGAEPLHADVRFLAATNRDLTKAVQQGQFRDDLYYRLNVITITLPPLRQRKEDIPLLVQHFVETLAAATGKKVDGVSKHALDTLLAHDWPGNVRELRNVLERAVVVAPGAVLEAGDLGLTPGATGGPPATFPRHASLDDVEHGHIAHVLADTGGNVTRAARILGIDRVTLYNKMKRYGLKRVEEPVSSG